MDNSPPLFRPGKHKSGDMLLFQERLLFKDKFILFLPHMLIKSIILLCSESPCNQKKRAWINWRTTRNIL